MCRCGGLCLTVQKSGGKNVFFNSSRVQNFECLVPDRPVTILPRWRMKASDLTADYAKRSRSGTPVQSLSIKLSYNKNKPCRSLLINLVQIWAFHWHWGLQHYCCTIFGGGCVLCRKASKIFAWELQAEEDFGDRDANWRRYFVWTPSWTTFNRLGTATAGTDKGISLTM